MLRPLLRLTLSLAVILITLVLLMQPVAGLMPFAQIIPIVTFGSPTILLIDSSRQLVAARQTNPSVIFDAAVSPDQQKIAFSMVDQRNIHIYTGGLYDKAYQRITQEEMGGTNPAWSPDSHQLVFVGLEPDNKRGIYTVDAEGKSPPQNILKAGTFASPAWSPDGRQLIFASSRFRDLPDLFVVDANCRLRCDRELTQVTNLLVVDTLPIWSPDGSQIAFLSDRDGDYEIYKLDMRCLQVGVQPCRSQTPQRLRLRRPIVPFLILWSLDSRVLYFRAWDAVSGQPGLYTVNADCVDLAQGCQPRLVYNLATLFQSGRGLKLYQ